jgi:phosphatidylserine/phosphatidylglycerophosphate/cardiolipin synthase-like enzyme
VLIRTKQRGGPQMHFKAYQIDGHLLRSGAANFSPSGLKSQDNDLIIVQGTEAAEAFRRNFDRVFLAGDALE